MSLQSRSALIVEDSADFANILAHLLKPWELDVVTISTVEEALAIVSRRSFDLYAIDLKLADTDAALLLTLLDSQGPAVSSRCIVVTGFPFVAPALTRYPVVSKVRLSSIGPELVRILGDPFNQAGDAATRLSPERLVSREIEKF